MTTTAIGYPRGLQRLSTAGEILSPSSQRSLKTPKFPTWKGDRSCTVRSAVSILRPTCVSLPMSVEAWKLRRVAYTSRREPQSEIRADDDNTIGYTHILRT